MTRQELHPVPSEWNCKPSRLAECHTCGKSWSSPNADGIGALHARKHKHYVHVETTLVKVYKHAEPA